jgi:hypothetical protein
MTRKKKRYTKRESIQLQINYAARRKIKEINELPNPRQMVRAIASHHGVSLLDLNEDMAIAWIRHCYTNYDYAIFDTKKIHFRGQVNFTAVSSLKEKANDKARKIYRRLFPQGIENFVKPRIVVIR